MSYEYIWKPLDKARTGMSMAALGLALALPFNSLGSGDYKLGNRPDNWMSTSRRGYEQVVYSGGLKYKQSAPSSLNYAGGNKLTGSYLTRDYKGNSAQKGSLTDRVGGSGSGYKTPDFATGEYGKKADDERIGL